MLWLGRYLDNRRASSRAGSRQDAWLAGGRKAHFKLRKPMTSNNASQFRSARTERNWQLSLMPNRACGNRFLDLLLNGGHIETGAGLHRWEIDQ